MRFAERSVPKKKDAFEEYGGNGEPLFCSLFEGTKEILRRFPVGKIILLCDEEGYAALADFARFPRVMTVVQRFAEVLPPFALSDSPVCIVATGGEGLLRAARYCAGVMKAACVLFPRDAAFYGVYEARGEVLVDGRAAIAELVQAEVWVDVEYITGFARAYARNLLARLALFEGRALCLLRGDKGDFEGLSLALGGEEEGKEEVLARSISRAKCERFGAYGEGVVLANAYGEEEFSEWQAYVRLTALYGAFLKGGVPRRYALPDYRARCIRAGVGQEGYLAVRIPTVEEYSERAMRLEKFRGQLLNEISPFLRKRKGHLRTFLLLGGKNFMREDGRWRELAEHAPTGLSALIRDFGLLESELGAKN